MGCVLCADCGGCPSGRERDLGWLSPGGSWFHCLWGGTRKTPHNFMHRFSRGAAMGYGAEESRAKRWGGFTPMGSSAPPCCSLNSPPQRNRERK